MKEFLIAILSSMITFCFAYFLFKFQRKEIYRTELFKRKLDFYDEIRMLMQEIDVVIHKNNGHLSGEDKNRLIQAIFNLGYSKFHYGSPEVRDMFTIGLVSSISDLPDSLAEIEEIDQELFKLISEEVGTSLITPEQLKKVMQIKKSTLEKSKK